MAFIARYAGYPSDAELTSIEGFKIVEIGAPTSIAGLGSGTVAVVGEFLKGVVNIPVEVFSPADIAAQFGLWSNFSNPGGTAFPPGMLPASYDGNGTMAYAGRSYARLILVNVEQSVGICTVTIANPTSKPSFTIPAGTRVQDATGATGSGNVFALLDDVLVTDAMYTGTGGTATPFTATIGGNRMRRVYGSSTGPTADSFVAADAAAIAPSNTTLDCTVFSTVSAMSQSVMEASYSGAIATLLNDAIPANQVNVVYAARHTPNIATYLKAHAIAASNKGRGRIALNSPVIGTAKATAEGSGSGMVQDTNVSRSDRVIYAYPGVQVNFPFITQATISASQPALQDWTFDASVASVLSNLSEEYNPGVKNNYLGHVLGIESAITGLTIDDYKAFKRLGICAPIIDPANGAMIQSGVTSVDPTAYPTLKNIARRRMADKIEDDIAAGLAGFSKGLNTPTNRRAVGAVIREYLDGLLSPDNTAKQRILGYQVDEVSGNTPAMLAQGIFVVIIKVQTISSMDYIVIQAEIGETVTITVL